MVFGAAYFFAAAMLATWLHDGGPIWLNLLVLLGICYAVLAIMPMMVGGAVRGAGAGVWLSA